MWFSSRGGGVPPNPLHGGGNANNGSNCAPGYVNANNGFGNSNWNIVPQLTFQIGKTKIFIV